MARIWVLQHFPSETLGTIANFLEPVGIIPDYIRTFDGEPVPDRMGDAVGLVVMGGPMGVYDHPRYPFLLDEMRLIEQALREDKPVLGVCLGSQLLAATLGATVKPGKQKEIGWIPVTLAETALSDALWTGVDSPFTALHWHGDVFELPQGAVSLASSALTECQAFRYGRNAYGFLFHVEVTLQLVEDMVASFADEAVEAGADPHAIAAKAAEHLPRLRPIADAVFQRWTNLLQL